MAGEVRVPKQAGEIVLLATLAEFEQALSFVPILFVFEYFLSVSDGDPELHSLLMVLSKKTLSFVA